MNLVAPDDDGMRRAVEALRAGEVVAHPTETVYGLAVNPFSPEALERLWETKGRDAGNPVLLIVSGVEQLHSVVREVSTRAHECIECFWPGPLTLLLPKAAHVPETLTAGRAKVAVRCPGHVVARRLCHDAGMALTSTSANRSGQPPATRPSDIVLEGVSLCIDAGPLAPSAPSTVYDPDEDRIVREGAVPADVLRTR